MCVGAGMTDLHGTSQTCDRSDRVGQVGIEPEAVREQLACILASPDFEASERNRRFFGYVVEETLARRGDRLKAYNIALAVFGRDESFDAQNDPIVRIEAARLRRSLEHYYLLAGKDDPIRIEIPKGAYAATWRLRDDLETSPAPEDRPATRPDGDGDAPASADQVAPPPDHSAAGRQEIPQRSQFTPQFLRRPLVVGLLGLLVVGLGALTASAVGWHPWSDRGQLTEGASAERRPSLMVVPFEDLGNEPGDHFALGVAQEILSGLIRFQEFVVFDARTAFEKAEAAPLELGRRLGADYALTGTVRRDAGRVRVSSQLINLDTGASIWTASFDEALAVEGLFAIQDRIAASVAAAVAQPYGVVYRDARDRLRQHHIPGTLSAYECLMQGYAYRQRIAAETHATARSCLEQAVVQEPDYADALAMLAVVYLDEFRWGFNPRPDHNPLDRALEMAERAVDAAPDNAFARLALAETLFFHGELDRAFAEGERAVDLNPNHSEVKAMVGMRLAHSGQWERGIGLVEEALAMNPAPPGWYYLPMSTNAFRQGEDETALDWAKRIDLPGFYWTHALCAAIYAELGWQDNARMAVERLLELYPNFEERASIELSRRHFDPVLLNRLVSGLRKAGLDISASMASNGETG